MVIIERRRDCKKGEIFEAFLAPVRAWAPGPSTCPPELLSWWPMQSSPTLLMPTLGMLAKNHPLPNFHLPLAQPLTHVRFVALTDLFPPPPPPPPLPSYLLTQLLPPTKECTNIRRLNIDNFPVFCPPLNKQAAIEALKDVHMLHTY